MVHDFQKQMAAFVFFVVDAITWQNQKQCPEFAKLTLPGIKMYEVMAPKNQL